MSRRSCVVGKTNDTSDDTHNELSTERCDWTAAFRGRVVEGHAPTIVCGTQEASKAEQTWGSHGCRLTEENGRMAKAGCGIVRQRSGRRSGKGLRGNGHRK